MDQLVFSPTEPGNGIVGLVHDGMTLHHLTPETWVLSMVLDKFRCVVDFYCEKYKGH